MLGIIGCICFGIGDWLLGYVYPGRIGVELDCRYRKRRDSLQKKCSPVHARCLDVRIFDDCKDNARKFIFQWAGSTGMWHLDNEIIWTDSGGASYKQE